MSINTKVAKIPFLLLYLVNAFLISFNFLKVILFQEDFTSFATEQPWDHFLATKFSEVFSTSYRSYFIFALPVYLVLLFIFLKLFGKLIDLDKRSNVRGENHIAVSVMLFIMPVTLGVHKLLGSGWKNFLFPGFVLIILFSIISGIDEQRFKKG